MSLPNLAQWAGGGVTTRTWPKHIGLMFGTALHVATGRYDSYRHHVGSVVRGVLGKWVSRWVGSGGGGGVVVALLDGRGATGIPRQNERQIERTPGASDETPAA